MFMFQGMLSATLVENRVADKVWSGCSSGILPMANRKVSFVWILVLSL